MANPVTDTTIEPKWTDRDSDGLREYWKKVGNVRTDWLALVNIQTQTMHLLQDGAKRASYWVSTAKNGPGQEENSGKTPLGLHRVEQKIGDGAAPYAIFKSRELTGKIAEKEGDPEIVGRIFWLSGLEKGVNLGENEAGKCVDTFDRYIYIHGTNKVSEIGKALSAGCVRVSPEVAVELFDCLKEGSHVYIYS